MKKKFITSSILITACLLIFGGVLPASATVETGVTTNLCPAGYGFIDFEEGIDGAQIVSQIPGVQFSTTMGLNWLYADVRTGRYNARSLTDPQYNRYGRYVVNGYFFAWLGETGDRGRIDFTEGTASYFSLLTSTYSGLTIDAYDSNDNLIATSGWANSNLNTGTFTRLTVNAPGMAYVIIHDWGNYWEIDDICTNAPGVPPAPSEFWVEMKEDGECIYQDENLTTKLKCLPQCWILKVPNPEKKTWERIATTTQIEDVTDNLPGWTNKSFLNYNQNKQIEWKEKTKKLDPSKNPGEDGTVPVILEAVDRYYNNTDIIPSLYSSDDNSNHLSLFKNAGFPIELILSIIATESFTTRFDNENITFDYGHGISQATFRPEKYDVKRLQIVLNSDPDTQVATSGPGSLGKESDTFGNLTEIAVKKFQEKYNIVSGWGVAEKQGIVYSATRNKLNEILDNNRSGFEILSIPRNFEFEDRLKKGNYDFVYKPNQPVLDNRGVGSGIKIPPCEEIKIKDELSSNHYKNCYRYKYTPDYLEYREYEPHQNYNNQIFKHYSNTLQSVYSNIKDGLKVLQQSYKARCFYETLECKNVPAGETRVVQIDSETSFNVTCGSYTNPYGTVYNSKVTKINGQYKGESVEVSCSDFKIIDTTWRYNGRVTDPEKKYLKNVGEKITQLNSNNYFGPNYKNYINPVLPTDQLEIWKRNLAWADTKRSQIIAIHSPGDLRVYDSQGRSTGITNGEIVEDIPFSVYDEQNGFILLPFAYDSYSYEVKGNEEGAYGLDIISIDNETNQIVEFNATDIPVGPNEVHQYAIDWTALVNNERGVTLKVDYEGDGIFDKTVVSDKELNQEEFILQTETVVDIDPDTLNLKSKGNYITAYIELPEGFDVSTIDVFSIKLNETIQALSKPATVGDYDNDGIKDLMVKFDRSKIQTILNPEDNVKITISGKVFHNQTYLEFRGDDTIRVIK